MICRTGFQTHIFPAPVTLNPDGVPVIYPHVDDPMAQMVARTGRFYEADVLDRIARLKRSGVYVDAGAHVGNHSVFFSRFCPSTTVVAIEIGLDTADLLTQNLTFHSAQTRRPCYIVNAAVGLRGETWASISDRGAGMNTGGARAGPPREAGWAVPVVTIDGVMDAVARMGAAGHVALLKLDVEGCEVATLEGARQVLKKSRPVVVAEASGEDAMGAITDTIEELAGCVYSVESLRTSVHLWTPE